MVVTSIVHHTNNNWKVDSVNVDGKVWFRGKDVAAILGYSDAPRAIQTHVRSHQTNRQTDKQAGKQADTESHKQTDKHASGQGARDGKSGFAINGKAVSPSMEKWFRHPWNSGFATHGKVTFPRNATTGKASRHTSRHTNRQADKPSDKQTGKQPSR